MRKHIIWTYEREMLQNILDSSNSYDDLFEKLNLIKSKSLIKMLQYRLKKDNLDRKCFKQNIKRNKFPSEKNLEEILVENSKYIYTNNLKKKLIKLGVIKNECSICKNNGQWLGKEIILQLDHINGVSNDNRLENLRLLCPNCHSQTDTYAGKKKKGVKDHKKLKKCQKCKCDVDNKVFCDDCDKEIKIKLRKVDRPSVDELIISVKKIGYSATGRKYGVSDNSIRKWIKNK